MKIAHWHGVDGSQRKGSLFPFVRCNFAAPCDLVICRLDENSARLRAMFTQAASIIAVLVGLIALAEWLVQRTWLRHLGVALLVIVFAALAANLNIIPAYGPETPIYGAIFEYVAPLGIFWLLLTVDLRSLTKVGTGTLTLFLIGALGTVLGVVVAHWLVGGEQAFGPLRAALSGMYPGTYIGGQSTLTPWLSNTG